MLTILTSNRFTRYVYVKLYILSVYNFYLSITF